MCLVKSQKKWWHTISTVCLWTHQAFVSWFLCTRLYWWFPIDATLPAICALTIGGFCRTCRGGMWSEDGIWEMWHNCLVSITHITCSIAINLICDSGPTWSHRLPNVPDVGQAMGPRRASACAASASSLQTIGLAGLYAGLTDFFSCLCGHRRMF